MGSNVHPMGKVMQTQKSMPSKGPQVTISMPSKPHLIQEPPKCVHQIPPFQIKQMLKDLISFSKCMYGRVVMVTYWVSQSLSQGMFPKKTLYKSCDDYEVDWGNTFGHGVLDISRVYIVSFMGSYVEGVLRPLFAMQNFSNTLPFNLLWSEH
jgi:hypothetical protein